MPQVMTAPRQQPRSKSGTPARAGIVPRRRFSFGAHGIASYIRELRSEIRKVVWPSRREWTNLTIVVLAISATVGVFLGAVDFIFQEFFRFVLRLAGQGI